jgi:zinc transporter 7
MLHHYLIKNDLLCVLLIPCNLLQGFTAGGFIYIAVAGVLPQMNDQKTTVSNSMTQLVFLTMGILVALGISLVE